MRGERSVRKGAPLAPPCSAGGALRASSVRSSGRPFGARRANVGFVPQPTFSCRSKYKGGEQRTHDATTTPTLRTRGTRVRNVVTRLCNLLKKIENDLRYVLPPKEVKPPKG